ncbi:protein-disulfide reductase DsbD [Thalassotalea profundi]|nr:protein-disulfide reductase DsbD [Thalassotalea profundi]
MKNIFLLCISLLISSYLPLQVNAQQSIFDTSSSALFSNEDEFLKSEQAFQFSFYQAGNKLNVSFAITDGYYLYKEKFKFTAENSEFEPPVLPQGIEHEDEFFGVQDIYTQDIAFVIDLTHVGDAGSISMRYQGCAFKGLCYPPEIQKIDLTALTSEGTNTDILSALNANADAETHINDTNTRENSNTLSDSSGSEQYQLANMLQGDNLTLTLIAFFIGGLLLAFTPCVFPMYPILTGIIVGQGDQLSNKKAFKLSFIYVQGMAITYTALGIVVALAGAQFQAMFQHPAVLITLSIVFVLLALSMFGAYNLALPSSWQNKLNNLSNKQKGGSSFGVFVMGVISGLVASPCTTAPLTGALLYISQSGDVVLGASALYALSLGMGIPLLILGSSGGKLLPKAGNWMTIIKNIFGLLLLSVPIFLLERLIDESIVQLLWAALLIASGCYFYLANHNTKVNFYFILRSLVIFALLFYGVQKAINVVSPAPVSQNIATTHNRFIDIANLEELDTAIMNANSQNQTVMVDLYADWCVACKEFEEYTFPDQAVISALSNTVLIRIDLTDTGSSESKALMKKYDVFGLPSILFFDLQGQELTRDRVTGFMQAAPFAEHINRLFNEK